MTFERPTQPVAAFTRLRDALFVRLHRFRHSRTARAARVGDPTGSPDDARPDGHPGRPGRPGRRGRFVALVVTAAVFSAGVGGAGFGVGQRVARPRSTAGAPNGPTIPVAPLAELPLITLAPTSTVAPPTTAAVLIAVHAAGALRNPGVYLFPAGARVDDLLAAAGGVRGDAFVDSLNLAAPLSDGQRVWVPVRGQPVPSVAPLEIATPVAPPGAQGDSTQGDSAQGNGAQGRAGGTGGTAGEVFNLNTVSAEQLDALPGIGPSTAAAIIAYRSEHKRFTSVGELLNVRGIGEAKLRALRGRLRV